MEQVAISSESYGDLFRNLSSKKRNGVLAIQFEDSDLRMQFREGRIVGVFDPNASEISEIASRLVASGCIMEKVQALVEGAGISVNQLHDLLVGKDYVSDEDYRRAIESYQLDLLHSLEMLDIGYAEFSPKLVRSDARHALSIYPAQFLLDVEELRGDRERLHGLFSSFDAVNVTVRESEQNIQTLSEREQRILDAAEQGCRMSEMISNCLMSQHEAIECLLTLYDQDIISLVEDSSILSEEFPLKKDSLTDAASDSADSSDSELEYLTENEEVGNEDDQEVAARTENFGDEDFLREEEVSVAQSDSANVGLRARVRAGSYHLLNPAARSYAILLCTSLYLVALAVFGTSLFEQWFLALGEFSSK